MTPASIRSDLHDLLARLAPGKPYADHDDLFERRVVKSIQLIELVSFVEDRYRVTVDTRDLFEGRLRSVDAIVAFIVAGVPGALS